jgi:hypothetical protein
MDITEFATRQRLKGILDDGERVIKGKSGQIYEHSEGELGVIYITSATKAPRIRRWRQMSSACLAAGMTLQQMGDAEGCLSFNPTNPEHVQLAIKLAGVKRKRQVSPEHLAKLASVGFKAMKHTVERASAV